MYKRQSAVRTARSVPTASGAAGSESIAAVSELGSTLARDDMNESRRPRRIRRMRALCVLLLHLFSETLLMHLLCLLLHAKAPVFGPKKPQGLVCY